MTAPNDWWRTFFSGWTVDSWLRMATPEQTRQEVDFIRECLSIPPPARLLDVPCGGGRHCFALAANGYEMTGVDISAEFLEAARLSSASDRTRIAWEHREMRDLPWCEAFDGAYCLGNSFGYLDEDGNADFLRAVANALKPGARFILETGYVAETLLPVLQERTWFPVDESYWLAYRTYNPIDSRLQVEYIFISNGAIDRRTMSARVYTCREIIQLLEQSGFTDVQTYGSLAKGPFGLGSRHLLIVATRA